MVSIHTYNAQLFGVFDGEGEISKKTKTVEKINLCLLYGAVEESWQRD